MTSRRENQHPIVTDQTCSRLPEIWMGCRGSLHERFLWVCCCSTLLNIFKCRVISCSVLHHSKQTFESECADSLRCVAGLQSEIIHWRPHPHTRDEPDERVFRSKTETQLLHVKLKIQNQLISLCDHLLNWYSKRYRMHWAIQSLFLYLNTPFLKAKG